MGPVAFGLGLLGALLNVLWPLFGGRRGMLLGQVGVSLCFLAHFALIGAITGAIMNALSALQALLAIPLGEHRSFRYAYLATLPVIAVVLALSWTGTSSAYAAIGLALISIGRFQLSTTRFRVFLLAAVAPWVAHNVAVASVPGLIADTCAFSAGLFALIRSLRAPRDES